MSKDFAGAFAALREILRKHSGGMIVARDTPTDFTVVTRAIAPNKKPMWFCAVLLKKSAVTYHLMPLYFNPKLNAQVPPQLLARKQGKTCFNFQRPDDELFQELDRLTQLGREQWKQCGFLDPGAISKDKLEAALRSGGENPERIARLRRTKAREAAKKRAATILRKKKPSK